MTEEVGFGKNLTLHNSQRFCRINLPRLRQAVRFHLENQLGLASYDIAVVLISSRRITQVNQTALGHEGPTDVITFDYGESQCRVLHGELLVCPEVAVTHAREFGTSWQTEILRYIIHGILHLQGYNDCSAADRRVMKRAENRRLRGLTTRHPAARLSSKAVSRRRRLSEGSNAPRLAP